MLKRYQLGFMGLAGPALWLIIGLAVALGLTLLGSSAAIWFLDGKLDKANERVVEAEKALGKEETSRKGFQVSATTCSASVEALEKRAGSAERAFAAQKGQSEALTGAVQSHIRALLTSTRKPGEDECAAMRRNLDEEIDLRAARAAKKEPAK